MSNYFELRKAVTARMVADAPLAALLARDPNGTNQAPRPAIFNARKSAAPPVYDCLTWRIPDRSRDARFRPALPRTSPTQAVAGGVQDVYLDIEAWTQQPSSEPIENIAARLDALFENIAFAFVGGRVFKSEVILSQTDLWDEPRKAFFGLFRVRLRVEFN